MPVRVLAVLGSRLEGKVEKKRELPTDHTDEHGLEVVDFITPAIE